MTKYITKVEQDLPKPTEIIWLDASHINQRAAMDRAYEIKQGIIVKTAGYVIAETDIAITLAHSLTDYGDAWFPQNIPIGMILKRREL